MNDDEAAETPHDPIHEVQQAIAAVYDNGAYLTGWVVVGEWIEPDGKPSMTVFHSQMSPWHRDAMLAYARDQSKPLEPAIIEIEDDEDGDTI